MRWPWQRRPPPERPIPTWMLNLEESELRYLLGMMWEGPPAGEAAFVEVHPWVAEWRRQQEGLLTWELVK